MSDDGKTVAVSGMVTDPNLKTHHARVKLYYETSFSWGEIGTIDSVERASLLEDTRAHVALSGDAMKLAISLMYRENLGSVFQGTVDIYEYTSPSTWTVASREYSGDGGDGGEFHGITASLDYDGSKIAIGIQYDDGTGPGEQDRGAVMVCKVGLSSCETFNGIAADARAGSSVQISRNTPTCVVYGSVGMNSATIMCDENDDDIWTARGALTGEQSGDDFGFSVTITSDSEYIAVGAIKNDPDPTKRDAGHVRVYKYEGGYYVQVGQDIDGVRGREDSVNYYVGDKSGYSIALSDKRSDDYIRVAIGAPNNPGTNEYYEGHTRIFECDVSALAPVWNQVLVEVDGETERESAGRSISFDKAGLRIIYGSPLYSAIQNGYYKGSASVYELRETSAQPSDKPSMVPSEIPSISVSPSESPTDTPSISVSPSETPSDIPSTSINPSKAPSDVPSTSTNPSKAPSDVPSTSASPSESPSDTPSKSVSPSQSPSDSPSTSVSPSSVPSETPSISVSPSSAPSDSPSNSLSPSKTPSEVPSTSLSPSGSPSDTPTVSVSPSESPSETPSTSLSPSGAPSDVPSISANPSSAPSDIPSISVNPSSAPSDVPSTSVSPSAGPSILPSVSVSPSESPSDVPSTSVSPSSAPSDVPSVSVSPSESPSDVPSTSVSPSSSPSDVPSISVSPSSSPSDVPSTSISPSSAPSDVPSVSVSPSESPSDAPSLSVSPSGAPSENPSVSLNPSKAPSDVPSTSLNPSKAPSNSPSESVSPSSAPSDSPSSSQFPSESPSDSPSTSVSPSESPSNSPSASQFPSESPSDVPSTSLSPSDSPSNIPTVSQSPSESPSDIPSLSLSPSGSPSEVPSVSSNPSKTPSDTPSISQFPSESPTLSVAPSTSPTNDHDQVFQIRTTYDGYDFTNNQTWCLTAESTIVGVLTKVFVRKCDSVFPGRNYRHRLWSTNAVGEIYLATLREPKCLTTISRKLYLDNCGSGSETDDTKKFEFVPTGVSNHTYIEQEKNGNILEIGLESGREFARSRLFKFGTTNPSIAKWYRVYGWGPESKYPLRPGQPNPDGILEPTMEELIESGYYGGGS